jgi:hypothetical protein
MKKVKSGNLSSAAKGNIAPKNVDEYLAGVPEPASGRILPATVGLRLKQQRSCQCECLRRLENYTFLTV